jgi:hypothetical protein
VERGGGQAKIVKRFPDSTPKVYGSVEKINNAKAWTSDEDGDFGSSSSPMSRPLTPPQT